MKTSKTNTAKENTHLGNIHDTFVKSFFSRMVVFADLLEHYGNKKFVVG